MRARCSLYSVAVVAWTTWERSWSEVREFLAQIDWIGGEDAYPIDIIDSVIAAGADRLLAVDTSMHDLVIAPAPATPRAATDVIVVCARGCIRSHPLRTIRIDFDRHNGKPTTSVRQSGEALGLFWRFIEDEFGILPSLPLRPDDDR